MKHLIEIIQPIFRYMTPELFDSALIYYQQNRFYADEYSNNMMPGTVSDAKSYNFEENFIKEQDCYFYNRWLKKL